MEKLIMLGTGSSQAVKCYNACFALQDGDEYLLVDGGGGSGILRQLAQAGIAPEKIHNIYLSQSNPESIFGVIWVIKMIGSLMRTDEYDGELKIYCQSELVAAVHTLANITLPRRFIWLFDHRILFVPVYDGDMRHMMDHRVKFFAMESNVKKQFGFTMAMDSGKRLVFAGAGLLPESCFSYAENADWLIHEAYCLHSQKDKYLPYAEGRCTVRDACETAAHLGIPELILWQTEEDNLSHRRDLYTAEAKLYYRDKVRVPDELDVIELA